MKPPQFAVWMFQQLGARAGDELVDLCPGSGAISEAWCRYTGNRRGASDTAAVDARHVARDPGPAGPRAYELAAVCRKQALTCPVTGTRCEAIACIDVGCTAEDADLGAERAA